MKRLYRWIAAAFGVVFFLWMPAVTAYADAIWEPYGDFYENHYQECKIVAETYLSNGKEGYVTLYQDPVSSQVIGKIKNGKNMYIGCIWKDKKGKVWGAVALWSFELEEGESLTADADNGWVLMADMAEIYHEDDFRKDHDIEFEEYRGELDDYEIQDTMYMWTYPGSGIISQEMSDYFGGGDVPVYEYLYTDADGRRWTRINYYYGIRNCWVCIDDPENGNLTTSYGPGEITQELYPVQAPESGSQTVVMNTREEIVEIAVVSVVAVVAVTAVLIAVIFRKKK